MKNIFIISIFFLIPSLTTGQDLSLDLIANDMGNHPMQEIGKPAYLEAIIDPSFGTTIRRITDAGEGKIITPCIVQYKHGMLMKVI